MKATNARSVREEPMGRASSPTPVWTLVAALPTGGVSLIHSSARTVEVFRGITGSERLGASRKRQSPDRVHLCGAVTPVG